MSKRLLSITMHFKPNCEKDDFNFTTGRPSPVDSYQASAQIVNAPSSKACFVKAAIRGWCQKREIGVCGVCLFPSANMGGGGSNPLYGLIPQKLFDTIPFHRYLEFNHKSLLLMEIDGQWLLLSRVSLKN